MEGAWRPPIVSVPTCDFFSFLAQVSTAKTICLPRVHYEPIFVDVPGARFNFVAETMQEQVQRPIPFVTKMQSRSANACPLGSKPPSPPITKGNRNNSTTGAETQELQEPEGGALVLLVLALTARANKFCS